MPRTRVLPLTPLFTHVLQCIGNLNCWQFRTRVALPMVYTCMFCAWLLIINDRYAALKLHKAANPWMSHVYMQAHCSCMSSKSGRLQVQQEEGCDFSLSLWPYSGFIYLFTHLFCWKKCWSSRFLCLEFSGDWNARWKLAENNYKIQSTACIPLSVSGLF